MAHSLYRVKVSTEVMVLAESESEVREVALKNAAEEVAQLGTTEITEVAAQQDVPSSWSDVIPYPSPRLANNPKTCRQLSESLPLKRVEEQKPHPIVEEPQPIKPPQNIPDPPSNNGPIPGRLPVLRWDAL